jgi:hypothetical protein
VVGHLKFHRGTLASLFLLAMLSGVTVAQEADSDSGDAEGEPAVADKKEKDPDRGRFLALPIIITEPAIGEGLGAAVLYYHGKKKIDQPSITTAGDVAREDRKNKPPATVTGLFAFATNNETAGVGIGHRRTFKNDLYRFTGVFARANINTMFFVRDFPFGFSMEGNFFFSNLKRRIVDSNFFVGISASRVDATIDFDATPEDSFSSGFLDFSFVSAGIAGSVIYDSRDNASMPNSGQQVDFTYWRYDEALGGDFDYWKSRLKIHSFHEIGKKFVLGLRLDTAKSGGRVPFFALPFVRLRGIAALRYQGESAGAVEVEGRYNFAKRWSAVAFAGAGFAEARFPVADTEDDIRAYGAGVRFQALKEQNVWLELDLAKGPEDYAFYIQVGHPW